MTLLELMSHVLAVPGMPTNPVQGPPIPNGVSISWETPIDDGGFNIIDYKYEVMGKVGSSETVSSTTTSAKISGLGVAESYTFAVSAGNALGRSDCLNVSFESPDGK